MAWVVFRFVSAQPTPLPVLRQVSAFSLTNQLGEGVTHDRLQGQVWVANVIFSRCPTQCHVLSQQMAALQRLLQGQPLARLVSFTADPEVDTPSVLLSYGKRYGAESEHWWFLTGLKAELYRTAITDLGFTVVENSVPNPKFEDMFIHSNFFAVVDARGRLRAVVQGETPNAVRLLAEMVQRLIKEKQDDVR